MKTKLNKTWLLLVLAIVLSALAAWLTMMYLDMRTQAIRDEITAAAEGNKGQTVRVIVPTRNLAAGTEINAAVVAAREIAADLVYDGAIFAADFDTIKGQALIRAVRQGRPLRKEDLQQVFADFSGYVPPGKRAITVAIDELDSNANMVQPGNMIDLMLVLGRDAASDVFVNTSGNIVLPFLNRMKVLATGQRLTPGGLPNPGEGNNSRKSYTNLTLEVTPEQAGKLALAKEVGKLRAVLRNGQDEGMEDFGVLDQRNLLADVRERVRRATLIKNQELSQSAALFDATSGLIPVQPTQPKAPPPPAFAPVTAPVPPKSPAKPEGPDVEYIIGGQGGGGIAATEAVQAPSPATQSEKKPQASLDTDALLKGVQKQITEQLDRVISGATNGNAEQQN